VRLGVFVEAPAIFIGALLLWAVEGGDRMQDFAWLRTGALSVLHGRSPYSAPNPALLVQNNQFIYPPLDAYALVPVAVLPRALSYVSFLLLSLGGATLALRLLGVTDWRCYGVALLAPSAFFAFSEGALGPLLLLGAAAAWRFRDRKSVVALLVGITALAKLFMWPLIVWLAVTRRWGAAVGAVATGIASALISWAGIGFAGLSQYPRLLRVLDTVQIPKSYSIGGIAWDMGLPDADGTVALAVAAFTGCVAMAYVAKGADGDVLAFMLAVIISLIATPLLWLHYLILLLIPLGLARPGLSWAWAVPILLWITPNPGATPGHTWAPVFVLAVTLALAGLLIAARTRELAEGHRS